MYEYLTESERLDLIIEMSYENECSKLNAMWEGVNASLEAELADADLRVLTESGSDMDLEMYYEDATEKAGEKKDNIITRLIDAIKSFIDTILGKRKDTTESITASVNTRLAEDPNATIELDKDPEKLASTLDNMLKALKSPISTTDKETGESHISAGKVAAAVGAVGTAIVGIKTIPGLVKRFFNQQEDCKVLVDQYSKEIENSDIPDAKKEQIRGKLNVLQKIAGECGKTINSIGHTIGRAGKTVTGAVSDKIDNVKTNKAYDKLAKAEGNYADLNRSAEQIKRDIEKREDDINKIENARSKFEGNKVNKKLPGYAKKLAEFDIKRQEANGNLVNLKKSLANINAKLAKTGGQKMKHEDQIAAHNNRKAGKVQESEHRSSYFDLDETNDLFAESFQYMDENAELLNLMARL